MVIRMIKELSEDLSSIKTSSPKKDTLIEIKNNFQGNNHRVNKENQIYDLKHKEAKINKSEEQEEKNIPPPQKRIV